MNFIFWMAFLQMNWAQFLIEIVLFAYNIVTQICHKFHVTNHKYIGMQTFIIL